MITRVETLPRDVLRAAGYVPSAPDAATAAIDRRVAARSACAACGHRGLVYQPFVRRPYRRTNLIDSYRAFAVCPDCGHAEEF